MKHLDQIRWVVTDLDGTLTNARRQITERTATTLKRLEAKGITIFFATGRFYHDVCGLASAAGLTPSYILMNGAEVRAKDGTLLEAISMTPEDVQFSVDLFSHSGNTCELYTDVGEVLLCDRVTSAEEMKLRMRIMGDGEPNQWATHPRFLRRQYASDLFDLYQKRIEVRKVICFDEDINQIKAWKKSVALRDSIVGASSSLYNLEITDSKAQKGIILRRIAEKMGVDIDEILIFGDGGNDRSMMEGFCHTVAMANAVEEIDDIARYKAGHHDEDGVAKFLEEYVL